MFGKLRLDTHLFKTEQFIMEASKNPANQKALKKALRQTRMATFGKYATLASGNNGHDQLCLILTVDGKGAGQAKDILTLHNKPLKCNMNGNIDNLCPAAIKETFQRLIASYKADSQKIKITKKLEKNAAKLLEKYKGL